MKILYLDFETSPIVGWGWRVWESNMFHIMRDVQIITVAWAWHDDKDIGCISITDFKGYKPGIFNLNDKKLVEAFIPIFAKADYVVAQNGFGFDFKLWRTRLAVHGLKPHHEPKELDTKRWANKFMFSSKGQDNLARQLGTVRKMETDKHLHYDCIERGDMKKWKQMIKYNKQDVQGLKEIALRLAPHVLNLPNGNVMRGTIMECPNPLCDKRDKMIRRGERQTSNTGKVQTWQCNSCGKYARGPALTTGVLLR